MQPLSSIHVRTETLALTKLEVWWYLLMRLGPQLPANFEQVISELLTINLNIYGAICLFLFVIGSHYIALPGLELPLDILLASNSYIPPLLPEC
jgi:hypothetical protein